MRVRTVLSLLCFTLPLLASEEMAVQAASVIDFKKVFISSPFIYTLLTLMSIASLAVWIYSLATTRQKDIIPDPFYRELKTLLTSRNYSEAKLLCEKGDHLFGSLIQIGLMTKDLGPQVMIDAMKSEGKRIATPFWQKLSFLNDIAILAPMVGLLGTVIGMFYAFYDINRSVESINTLFDGLGVAVGSTVAGLVVAILAMIFSTTLKYRLVRALSRVENESLAMSTLMYRKQDGN